MRYRCAKWGFAAHRGKDRGMLHGEHGMFDTKMNIFIVRSPDPATETNNLKMDTDKEPSHKVRGFLLADCRAKTRDTARRVHVTPGPICRYVRRA
jgi:hypothetical protein